MSQKFTAPIGCEEGKLYPITETPATLTYAEPTDMSGLKTFALALVLAEASQYGDDVMLDQVSDISGGTITEQTAGETKRVLDFLSGRDPNGDIPAISTRNVAPVLGHSLLCRLRSKEDASVTEGWRAWFFYKVKFAPTSHAATGKTDSITYGVTDLSATMLANKDKDFADFEEFFGAAALAEARAWLRAQAGLPAVPPTP